MIVLFKLGMQMLWLRLIPNILIFANLIKQQHCNISYGLMLILLIRLAPPVIHLNFESYCLAFSQTNTIIYGVELFCYWLKISQSFQTARGCRQHHRLSSCWISIFSPATSRAAEPSLAPWRRWIWKTKVECTQQTCTKCLTMFGIRSKNLEMPTIKTLL